jgi:hypothetical protein
VPISVGGVRPQKPNAPNFGGGVEHKKFWVAIFTMIFAWDKTA